MPENNEAAKLRQRMERIRGKTVDISVDGLIEEANNLLDWKRYYRRSPWYFVGGAALLGYFVVPGRPRIAPLQISDQAIDRIFKARGYQPPKNAQKQATLVGSLIGMATTFALRTASGYAMKFATDLVQRRVVGRAESQGRNYERVYR